MHTIFHGSGEGGGTEGSVDQVVKPPHDFLARLYALHGEVSKWTSERVKKRRKKREKAEGGGASLTVLSFVLTYRTRHAIESLSRLLALNCQINARVAESAPRLPPQPAAPRSPRYASSRSPRYRWRLSIPPFHCLNRIIAFSRPAPPPKFLTREFTPHADYFQRRRHRVPSRYL